MSIFQNGGDCPSWTFKHCNLQLRRSICVSVQNFVLIGQIVGEILQFFDFFSKWRPSAGLDWLCACLDHQRRVFGGVCHSAKFGWNQCSSFDNMQMLIFNVFGLKMHRSIHASNANLWGILPPKWGAVTSRPPKGTSYEKHVIRCNGCFTAGYTVS